MLHGKKFAEISKNVIRYKFEEIVLDQNIFGSKLKYRGKGGRGGGELQQNLFLDLYLIKLLLQ